MTSRVGGAGPSAAPTPPDLLAPGFRFHPTDVELVAYYLKRKVAGRPLRVDAIGELDLYKREPWDLPALARLRSGDMEWYFFSPLDRKYANCSRTNRATPEGYWKTTGKDRPVHHAGRTVGMKKTLVFHSGRAPRGLRTNWVMHEYRLEPADDLPQDGYVVCRIFQKSAPGTQNGAQYGAPFVEEEWEVEEREGPVELQDGSRGLPDVGLEDYWQLTDFMEDMDVGNQQEDNALLTMGTAEQNGEAQLEDTLLLEDILNDQNLFSILNDQNLFNDVDGYINMPTRQEAMHISGNEENTDMGRSYSSPIQSDGFLELNDLKNMENVDGLSIEDLVGCLAGTCTDQIYPTDENNNMHGGEEFFDIVNENFEQPELFQVSPELPDSIYLQPNNNLLNPMSSHNIPDHSTEENLDFFDAPSHELGQENFAQMNDVLYTPIANSPGFDMVDELMAFFDATDANLHYAPLNALQNLECDDFFDHSNLAQEVGSGSPPMSEPSVKALGEGVEMGSSSSMRFPSDDNRSSGKADGVCDALDAPRHDSSDKSFKKRLVNMLGSIPSPPALAAEFPTKAVNQFTRSSVTHPASSIHVSQGMIHIRSLTMTSSGKHQSAHKNGTLGFLLSYGVAGSGAVGKSVVFEPAMKMHGGGALTVVLRGWFYVFFLSALFLAASFRIGVYMYYR